MDALDIVTNLQRVIPYYQAIFSADEHRVIGYEVLGRYRSEDGIVSLGPFFHDEAIPEEFRLEVDEVVTRKALDHFLLNDDHSLLIFLNQDANLLMMDRAESFLSLLFQYKEKGLSLDRIVLEINEPFFKGDFNQLSHLLTYIRTYGIRVALDHIGEHSSNLERISLLAPDILKMDLHELRKISSSYSYQDVLYSISLLARKMGATLLYEDIETSFQLQYAWQNGGRYYQGYYLAEPQSALLPADFLKDRLRQECHGFIQLEKKKLQILYNISEQFQQRVTALLSKYKKTASFNELISSLAAELSDVCFRIYVCDEDGFQKSANIFKKSHVWELQPEYYMKNWSWRPYFLENIVRMRSRKRGILSDLYGDIETGETIRTYSYPIDECHYLFIDLSYSYLFEHDAHY
ncbi:EAL domain-containing protein [Anoxybacillus rupiensis]|uniref:EAL domain-containing protein n=1 Tax=Anoxybacteroides rupiense TaxID=311460 RepID=A0ABD5IS24_9BACL|nr:MULTISPECIES: EAL-associated domain-containing protein [Anoxybacillus]KXG10374.1 putative EAL-domain containing protein YkuI [Anoxybacillus sp. P3H1B]MBS2770675.1 EAL domain-containing protein [Anoxybacillus rupiensis]MDE8564392.1 EAL domain-containing protein [Anoxybacillus rupiensis]MED5050316.1 EAL-associated domain-containing protein [Anoxybacillus rupiensis]OQM46385.1 diguanylate phosphodiesterase [Anoxybacillus sp. UARK-01]